MIDRLALVRDRVLVNARIAPGETLVDVGAGDGLIAFGALNHVGERGCVIFSDISNDLLVHDRAQVEKLGLVDRCRFVLASADDLSEIADASVNVVTTRSVLAYVGQKQRAFAEFFRVLRPGGRFSIYEPINRLTNDEPEHQFFGFDIADMTDIAHKINAAFERRQPVGDPMFDYDERDLLSMAAHAGFCELHLELHVDRKSHRPQNWDIFAGVAMNPLAPTLNEAISESLSSEEAERFTSHLKPMVEQGQGTFTTAVTYVWGMKEPQR